MEITGYRHAIVTHDFSGGDSIRGELEGVRHIPSTGLALEKSNEKFVSAGCFTSDVVALPFTSNEMALTWNAAAPGGARLLIEFRVRARDGNWSMWYQLGSWKPEKRLETAAEDPEYGPLLVDHLVASRPFDEVRYRFNFSSQTGGQTPLLRRVTICVTDNRERRDVGIQQRSGSPRSGAATDLPVPWLSQRDMKTVGDLEMIAAGVCAATSVAMVMRYLGVNVSVREIARRAYDPNAEIFGNWAYLIAAASEYGAVGWVQRFENLGEIEKMISEGTPVIASISYKRGDLRIKPDRQSVGHLLVVRGVTGKTENGDFICNDPDFENRSEGDGCVLSRLEFARAFFCHGAVGLILKRVTGDGCRAPGKR